MAQTQTRSGLKTMSFVDGYSFWKFASDTENLICRSCSFQRWKSP